MKIKQEYWNKFIIIMDWIMLNLALFAFFGFILVFFILYIIVPSTLNNTIIISNRIFYFASTVKFCFAILITVILILIIHNRLKLKIDKTNEVRKW